MRLDKLLANMGFGSRKEVKALVKTGAVIINGKPVKQSQTHLDPEKDEIMVHGEIVEYKEFIYLMMNKPQGYLSATYDERDKTVIELLEPEDVIFEPFPVGRLDKDTEGFILLTNDGKLSHKLLSPKKEVGKTYFARVEGRVDERDIETFADGVELDDGYITKPAELTLLTRGAISEIELTITEGKFHQVKRMFEAVGKRVIYLKRESIAGLPLDNSLELGEYRELTEEELEYLFTVTKN